MKNPEMSKRMKEYWASLTPEQRKERNRNWQRAGVETVKSPEVRAKQSRLVKRRWSDPQYKARHSAGIKKAWDESPPERREKISQLSLNLSDETRQKRREGIRRSWAERSEERKAEIASKTRQNWKNKSEEEVARHGHISSENNKKWWASLSDSERRRLTKARIDAMHTATGTDKPTSIETAVQHALDLLKVKYEIHKVIDNLTVDFYIPELNLVVECDGDYWHSLPKQKLQDMKRDYWLKSQGYRIVRISESKINEDVLSATKSALWMSEDETELPKSLQLTIWNWDV